MGSTLQLVLKDLSPLRNYNAHSEHKYRSHTTELQIGLETDLFSM